MVKHFYFFGNYLGIMCGYGPQNFCDILRALATHCEFCLSHIVIYRVYFCIRRHCSRVFSTSRMLGKSEQNMMKKAIKI